MKRFQNLLVYVNEEDDVALHRAMELTQESGARLTLMHVVEEIPSFVKKLLPAANDLQESTLHDWRERLNDMATKLRAEGLDVSTRVEAGKRWLKIIRQTLRDRHDLVIKSAATEDDEGGPFFSPGDMHLLRKCPGAVWMANPQSPPAKKILAAVDPTSGNHKVNLDILEMASSLCEWRKGKLSVLHVWQPLAESLVRSRLDAKEYAHYVKEAKSRVAKAFDDLLAKAKHPISKDSVHLVKGEAGYVIPEFVRQRKIGLVVMGTVAREGIAGFLIGNTAERVLNRLRCSVLAVKPPSFVSPVTLD